jgi:hypothetical protein
LLWGCGPKPEAKPPAPKAEPVAPQVVAEPPDLSPVKRPAEVVVVGRIARPKLLTETLAKWSALPVDIEQLIPNEARPLGRAVLWQAPIEMVVALDAFGEGKLPAPLVIGSVGLKSLDEALSAADAMQMPTRKLAPGVYRVGDFPSISCAVSVSLGAAPARLVCGRGTKDVDVLLPYATRGLPSEPQTGADFEVTLDAKPLQDRYGRDVTSLRMFAGVAMRQISLDSPRFDRALSDAIYGLVDETINVFNDLSQVRVEARLDAARNVLAASSEVRFKGESSWTAGTVASMKPVPLPATLPRLPPGTTLGSYNVGMPPERTAALARIAGELAEGYLEHEKLPEVTRKRARRVIDASLSKYPETFSFVVSPAQKDGTAARHLDTTVYRQTDDAKRLIGIYDDFFALVKDPAVRRWVKQKAGVKPDDKLWPKVTKKTTKLGGFKTPAIWYELTGGLESWTALDRQLGEMIESMVPPVDSKGITHVHFMVQPDGEHTYALIGDDPKEMARVMEEHRKAEPGVFFAKPAHDDKVISAGFVTLGYLARSLDRRSKKGDGEVAKAVSLSPHRGETPIPFSSTVGPGNARIDMELPAAVLADASSTAVAAAPALKRALDRR